LRSEQKLDPLVKGALAFADEKLAELRVLAEAATFASRDAALAGGGAAERIAGNQQAIDSLNASDARKRLKIDLAAIHTIEPQRRSVPCAERRQAQAAKWQLPLLPTTAIGSFPQTAEVRKARQLFRKGEWTR